MKDFEYFGPGTIDEAMSHQKKRGKGVRLLARGTELVKEMRFGTPQPEQAVDSRHVRALDFIHARPEGLKIGALRVFSQVVKCKSFSKAADLLFMTQPGVSNHIAQLEAQIGLTLIRRDKGRFEVTREGRAVYRYAERIEKMARELEDKLRVARSGALPLLRLGTTINYAKKIMPCILGGFQRKNPDLRIKLDAGSSNELEKTLLTGENDVLIVADQHPSNKIHSIPFVREELVLITAKGHPLAAKDVVTLSDISTYPFAIREDGSATRSAVLGAFAKMNITPSVLVEVNSTEFIKEWVARDKAISILTRRAVEGEEGDGSLAVLTLSEPVYLEVSVLFLKSNRHNAAIQRFIAYLGEVRISPDGGAATLGGEAEGATDKKA